MTVKHIIQRFETQETVCNLSQSERPHSAVTEANLHRVDENTEEELDNSTLEKVNSTRADKNFT